VGYIYEYETGPTCNVTLGRNTMKHLKAVVSAIFTLAKQQGYFKNQNPAWEPAINPDSAEPAQTYAYDLTEIKTILRLIPEPAATAFAVAVFGGLRHGEIQGVEWQDFRDGELHVERNVWNGKVGVCKTLGSRAAVPVIRQLAERLEWHRLRSGNPQTRPIFSKQCWPAAVTRECGGSPHLAHAECLWGMPKKERDHLRQTIATNATKASLSGRAGTLHGAGWEAICIA
jgi:integrase